MSRRAHLLLACLVAAPLPLLLVAGCGSEPDQNTAPLAKAPAPFPRRLAVDEDATYLRPLTVAGKDDQQAPHAAAAERDPVRLAAPNDPAPALPEFVLAGRVLFPRPPLPGKDQPQHQDVPQFEHPRLLPFMQPENSLVDEIESSPAQTVAPQPEATSDKDSQPARTPSVLGLTQSPLVTDDLPTSDHLLVDLPDDWPLESALQRERVATLSKAPLPPDRAEAEQEPSAAPVAGDEYAQPELASNSPTLASDLDTHVGDVPTLATDLYQTERPSVTLRAVAPEASQPKSVATFRTSRPSPSVESARENGSSDRQAIAAQPSLPEQPPVGPPAEAPRQTPRVAMVQKPSPQRSPASAPTATNMPAQNEPQSTPTVAADDGAADSIAARDAGTAGVGTSDATTADTESPVPRSAVSAHRGNAGRAPSQVARRLPPTVQPSVQPSSVNPAMRGVRERAAHHVRIGFTMAGRAAYFSARSDFIHALRILSQAMDEANSTTEHSTALAAGLRALEESDDFVPRGANLEANLKLETLVPAHQTPVLKQESLENVTAVTARRKYYTYAQEQLALAAGRDPAASMALYGLARVQATLSERQANRYVAAEYKAMVFHQAALVTDPGNFMAAHELAVLVARFGQYEQARALLVYSLRLMPQVAAWRNLAIVHQQLGETELAQQALASAEAMVQSSPFSGGHDASSSSVVWTDPKTFSGMGAPEAVPTAKASPTAIQR